MKIKNNSLISDELNHIAEVAGFLWQRGWAEANGGNISVNLTQLMDSELQEFPEPEKTTELSEPLPGLAGNLFYVTGAGKRMRDVAKSPLDFGAVIRVTDDGKSYAIVSEKPVKPTSELPSHLSIHNFLKAKGNHKSVVLHTHPTELIALTHCPPFMDWKRLTQMLWSMIPETRVLVPKGVGIVPYVLTGTTDMAKATIKQLAKHDVVLWEKHGAMAVGDDIMHCFDLLDTLTKSALIYLAARTAGFEPQGLSQEQMDELAEAFNLKQNLQTDTKT
jgi:rhamnulose-1-phosphate aldolase